LPGGGKRIVFAPHWGSKVSEKKTRRGGESTGGRGQGKPQSAKKNVLEKKKKEMGSSPAS